MKRFVTQKQPSPAQNFLLSLGIFLLMPSTAMLCMDIIRKAWKILSGITALPMTAAVF